MLQILDIAESVIGALCSALVFHICVIDRTHWVVGKVIAQSGEMCNC